MKSKHFASICTGTSNAFRRRAGTRLAVIAQVAMCARSRNRRPLAKTHGLIGPQAGQIINNNRVALSTTYTRAGVNRTVGAIDLEANGFFSEIPPEVVDEAGNPVTVTEAAAALPQMNGSGMVRNLQAAMSLSGTAADELEAALTAFAAVTTRVGRSGNCSMKCRRARQRVHAH